MHIDTTLTNVEQALDVERDTGYLVMLTARAFTRVAEKRLRPLGIGVAHLPVVVALAQDGPLTQKQVAARAHVEQPTATALLQRMDAAGLIERTPDPRDRRSVRISLSSRAARLLPEALGLRAEAVSSATADLSAAEVELLDSLLGRVLASLEALVRDQPEQ